MNFLLRRIQKLLGTYKIMQLLILPYRSYGKNFHLYIKGRVLDNKALNFAENQSFLKTLGNALRQFDTHEVPNCELMLRIGEIEIAATTDRKGYFLIDAILPSDISKFSDNEGWVGFEISSLDQKLPIANVEGRFLIPNSDADYGVISDIDDTILTTGVTSFLKWKVLFNSFFVNTFRRIPLTGAPDFYRKLHLGKDNAEQNPIFYLSNSPWNLYQYLKSFLDHNGFPKGPILLRSFNSFFERVKSDKPHKQKEILNLLEAYPDLNFILIGDSGEHDASIYTDIAAQFPNRILCIYLRSVSHKRKMRRVKSIVDNFRSTPVLLIENSEQGILHARESGFI